MRSEAGESLRTMVNTMTHASSSKAPMQNNPEAYEPVNVLAVPMIYGPTKPERLPSELISAMQPPQLRQ